MVGGVEVGDVEVDVLDAEVASRAELHQEGDLSKRFVCPARYHPQKEESKGVRSSILRPSSFRAPTKRRFRALPPSTSTFLKTTFLMVASRMRGAIARVGDGVFLCKGCPPTGWPY